jgi:hypothetical protein
MCGIVGFLSAAHLRRPSGLTSLANVIQSLTDATRLHEWEKVDDAVTTLAGNFDQMMSFAAFRDVVCDPAGKQAFRALASALKGALDSVTKSIAQGGSSDLLRKLNESLRDYLW